MSETFQVGVPLGGPVAYEVDAQAMATRLYMVLTTRPGQLPWRPSFGCGLGHLIGRPATAQCMSEAQWRIEAAIRRWVPEVKINHCRVWIRQRGGSTGPFREDEAESVLLRIGAQATLEVELAMDLAREPLSVSLTIEP